MLQEVALYKLSIYLKEIGCQALVDKYSNWFDLTLLQGEVVNYRETVRLAVLGDDDFDQARCCRLLTLLEDDPVSLTLLELCVAEASLPFLSKLLSELDGYYGLSFEFACQVTNGVTDADFFDYSATRRHFDQVNALVLSKPGEKLFFCRPFTVDERLFAFINQDDALDRHLDGICTLWDGKDAATVYAGEEYLPQIAAQLKDFDDPKALLHITGAQGVGKRFLLKTACRQAGVGLLFTDWGVILEREKADIPMLMRLVIREALLNGFAICLHGVTEKNAGAQEDAEKLVLQALEPIRARGIKTIVLSEDPVNLHPYAFTRVGKVEIKNHTRSERITYWERFCAQNSLATKLDCVAYASNFVLSPGEIEKVVLDLRYQEQCGAAISNETVATACYNAIKTLRQGNIKKIQNTYTLEDLKLPPEQKEALQNLCNHVLYRHQVYDTWGMEKCYPYGRGVSALFTGPPGTGKTMGAHILSSMIQMQLYRIDLSQVVDKYIGETEKRLEEIFDTAEKSNVILFFDEADAIFGKRSEVNDAKDKYANTETSYILQRIEEYDGIVILATNYKKNIDEAFMRRIRYLVEFPLPNIRIREEIWRGSFAKQVPLQSIDFPYLARQFELSGGNIKNIVLNATFLAAGEHSAVTMSHLLTCVRQENQKLGRPMLAQDFAEYSALQR
ncbi:MAG: ATP-binding protein [Oscillospiraceae bacterium]